jgi:hypothetical protein
MGSLPGVAAPGELHWLLERGTKGKGFRTRAGWMVDRHCRVCGPSCSVFTPEFVDKEHHYDKLYGAVAQRLRVSTLVVADKVPVHFKRCGKPGMGGIVLYKRPEAAVLSDMRNEGQELPMAANGWARMYDEYLKWADIFCGKMLCVAYEDLAARPLETMQALTSALELPVPTAVCMASEGYHAIGGNPKAYLHNDIVLDERWRTELTKEQQGRVANDNYVQRVFAMLERRRMRVA